MTPGREKGMEPVLRIELVESDGEQCVRLLSLAPERFTHYSFGTFLERVQDGEIEITQAALDALLKQPERSGLQGLELSPDRRLAWASPTPRLIVPLTDCSVPGGAKDWLRQCVARPVPD